MGGTPCGCTMYFQPINSDLNLNAEIFQQSSVTVGTFHLTIVKMLRLRTSTDPFCTLQYDLQLNVIWAAGIFYLASVVVGIFRLTSVRILRLKTNWFIFRQ